MADYQLAKDAVFEIAPMPAGTTVKPATAAFKDLCLMDEGRIGAEESSSVTLKNFCTNGEERVISVGQKGIAELSNMIFVDKDPTVEMFRTAQADKTELWLTCYPLGKGSDLPVRDVRIQVPKYAETIKVDDIIKLDMTIRAVNVPTYGRTPV